MRTCSSPKLWVGVAVGLLCLMNVGAVADELGRRPAAPPGIKDRFNLFPAVGAMIVVRGPNNVGLPEGIGAFWSGTLIHPQVFLTAGHCTGPGSFAGIPPLARPICQPQSERTRSVELATCRPADHASLDSPVPAAARLRSHLSGRFSRPGSRHLGHRTGDFVGAGDRRSTVQAGAGERPRVARRV